MSDLRTSKGEILENWTLSQSPRVTWKPACGARSRAPTACTSMLAKRQPTVQGDLKDLFPASRSLALTGLRRSTYPYPKTFASFQRAGAELLEPFDGLLKSESKQRFGLRVPDAQEVAIFPDKTCWFVWSSSAVTLKLRFGCLLKGRLPCRFVAVLPRTLATGAWCSTNCVEGKKETWFGLRTRPLW